MTKQPTGPPPKRRPASQPPPASPPTGPPPTGPPPPSGGLWRWRVAIAIAVVIAVVAAAAAITLIVLGQSDPPARLIVVEVSPDPDRDWDRWTDFSSSLSRARGIGLDSMVVSVDDWPGDESVVYFAPGHDDGARQVAEKLVPQPAILPLVNGGARLRFGIEHLDEVLDSGSEDLVLVLHDEVPIVRDP